jgi:sodium-dependent dicarboxylate transporter 2/3/5
LVETEASTWFVSKILPETLNLPAFVIVLIVAIIVFMLLVVIPVAPALISILAVPLVGLAAAAGLSPILLIMTLGLTVCNCFLLPLDTVPLITYMKGYYTKPQLAKTAVWIQLINAGLVAIWLPVIVGIFGL